MTRYDILKMAEQAHMNLCWGDVIFTGTSNIERFAALVAAAEREVMIKNGWRQCAEGQGTTQYCKLFEDAVKAEREVKNDSIDI